jgi:hypothetical protein
MTTPDLFDRIRAACAAVAADAVFVRIDEQRLPAFAASLPRDLASLPAYDDDTHFRGDPAATAAYILTLDTINFGSGWFPVLAKRPGMSGYYTIASSLTDRFREHGPIPAGDLAAISPLDCALLFGQEPGGAAMGLMTQFAAALNELGRWLLAAHEGRFLGPVEDADDSAATLATAVADALPGFRDIAVHQGREVPLMKRAQLLCADLALAFGNDGPGRFTDLHRMTIFADNLVPHVLRCEGVLRYAPELLARIEREELIPAGSPEETEIRAVALHACELIVRELGARGRPVTAAQLDFLLWNRGQAPAIKAHPRHRTRTIFY